MTILEELNKMVSLEGMDDFREVLNEWNQIAENCRGNQSLGKVFLPDYLLQAKPGTGVTTLLYLMTEYLAELGLMNFSLPTKYLEFLLEYDASDLQFAAFRRYYNLVEYEISQFGRAFEGVICIDITEWVENGACQDKRFIRFLEYLSQKDDKQIIVFLSNCNAEELMKAAESVIISFMRLRRIKIRFDSLSVLMLKLNECIEALGLRLDENASSELAKTLAIAVKEKGFDGIKTIQQLAKDIAYEKYSQSPIKDDVVSLLDISRFSADGEWLKQLQCHISRNIGFDMLKVR